MKKLSVNNFRFVKAYETSPPELADYKEILGYKTYHSNFNKLIYVVNDHVNNLFYAFEDEGSNDIENSLGFCIRTFIVKV